jgi:ubiquinone/menaquinone biosynthesis C-methylase UbiE
MGTNSLHRFSDRVDNYVKYRPNYPEAVYDFLAEQGIVRPGYIIADIGSGTGISAELFLKHGHVVYGVEPNEDMLNAAKETIGAYTNFKAVKESAEHTNLSDQSIDLISCAQAFHWFDKTECKLEFKRILKPASQVLLMWNDRRTPKDGFLGSYEDFLQMFGTDYKEVNHKNTQDKKIFDEFFGKDNYHEARFDNFQNFNFEGLKGRVLSSSYMPGENHPDYEFMIACLKKIFVRYQQNGTVRFEYDTKLYYGILN